MQKPWERWFGENKEGYLKTNPFTLHNNQESHGAGTRRNMLEKQLGL